MDTETELKPKSSPWKKLKAKLKSIPADYRTGRDEEIARQERKKKIKEKERRDREDYGSGTRGGRERERERDERKCKGEKRERKGSEGIEDERVVSGKRVEGVGLRFGEYRVGNEEERGGDAGKGVDTGGELGGALGDLERFDGDGNVQSGEEDLDELVREAGEAFRRFKAKDDDDGREPMRRTRERVKGKGKEVKVGQRSGKK